MSLNYNAITQWLMTTNWWLVMDNYEHWSMMDRTDRWPPMIKLFNSLEHQTLVSDFPRYKKDESGIFNWSKTIWENKLKRMNFGIENFSNVNIQLNHIIAVWVFNCFFFYCELKQNIVRENFHPTISTMLSNHFFLPLSGFLWMS